jgi:CBS domain containing-hemolysin-like protein
VLSSVALPLSSVLQLFRKLEEQASSAAPPTAVEATEQEIQAYLEIGEDEGIIEEEDSKLIQSVVEFGDTLVRKVMTPRTKIVACEEEATIGQLRDIMVQHRHSRIPIYRGDLDHIIGIAYIRQLLSQYAPGRESEPAASIVRQALFVPETKPVSALLRELQQRGDQAAIVIDEFGGVSGLVTMEDLLEEIVGEIRDEDQAAVSEIAEDGPQAYQVRGGCALDRLREATGRRFDGYDCSTAAGLVTAYLGRVPAPGEEFDIDGVRFRILDADRKKVHRIRVALPADAGPRAPAGNPASTGAGLQR